MLLQGLGELFDRGRFEDATEMYILQYGLDEGVALFPDPIILVQGREHPRPRRSSVGWRACDGIMR